MTLHELFPEDLLSDPQLLTVYISCIKDATDKTNAVRSMGKTIPLKPYECFVDAVATASKLNTTPEEYKKNLEILRDLGRIRLRTETENQFVVKHERLRFPIGPMYVAPAADKTLAIDEWVRMDLKFVTENFSHKYLELTEFVLKNFKLAVGPDRLLAELGKDDFEQFVELLRSRPNKQKDGEISKTSINNYSRALKASIRRALKLELLSIDPFHGIKPLREGSKSVQVYGQEELDSLRNVGPEWYQNVFNFSLNTGMRSGEATNLWFSDIDWEKRLVYIQKSDHFTPKGGRERTVYLNDDAFRILEECRRRREYEGRDSEYLFVDEMHRRITQDRVSKLLKSFIREAGFNPKLTFHALRRTMATRMRQQGTQLPVIQNALGQSSLKVTMLYLGVEEKEKEQAMRNLSFVSKPFNAD